jgi:DnaJ-class molecular chaperone
MANQDYYKVLGVSTDASDQKIKEAFRRKAFEFHPDRNQDNPQAAAHMKIINEAYAVLSHPDKRRQYDALRHHYGDAAHDHFRQTFSEQDIFRNSDVHQIFEEMARAFGLRGFDEIFKEFYGQGYRTFEFHKPGVHAKGFMFGNFGGSTIGDRFKGQKIVGGMAQKLLQKLTGVQLPQRGKDIHDRIALTGDFATQGGPYAYYLRQLEKKLVVRIPPGVRDGQLIRLTGMGQPGKGGAENGDLFLRVTIKTSLLKRLKSIVGLKK